jgi:tetratricopeptide (TPR) repeat protein
MSPALRIRFWLPTGTDSDILDLLAEAYFQNGDLANAIESEEKALRLLPLANGRDILPLVVTRWNCGSPSSKPLRNTGEAGWTGS